MKTFWLILLEKAIAALLSHSWDDVVYQVKLLTTFDDMAGSEKREKAFIMLRSLGVDAATWLLYAAIEIAYGKIKESK